MHSSQPKKKALFVQETLQPPGGANAVAAWMLESLKRDYALTVLTWNPVDREGMNRFYGTSLDPDDFECRRPSWPVRKLLDLDPDPGSVQSIAWLMRLTRRIRHQFDVVLTAGTEEMDFGEPAIQFIHFPHLSRFWPQHQPPAGLPITTKMAAVYQGRVRPWMWLADYSVDRFRKNLLIANSDWTADRLEEAYGVRPRTIYPAVVVGSKGLPWSQRENGFLTIGSLLPSKRMPFIVDIIARVRQQTRQDVRLHLVGPRGTAAFHDHAYYTQLCRLAEVYKDWLTLHEDLSREDLFRLLGSQRYGIHAQIDEHFGIAPAEILCSGCIPFVHNSGGQIEIVGRNPLLTYDSVEDAAAKISQVLTDPALQTALQSELEPRRHLFSTTRFGQEIRAAVSDFTGT